MIASKSSAADQWDENGVCWVDATTGEVVCSSITQLDVSELSALASALAGLRGGSIGSEKTQLILQLVEAILSTNVDEGCVKARRVAIVGAVQQQLSASPSSVMLYHWDRAPGDVMAAYFHYVGNYDGMKAMFDMFKTSRPTCV